jgi:hypothetical protein
MDLPFCVYVHTYMFILRAHKGIILEGLLAKKSDFHLIFIVRLMTPHLKGHHHTYTRGVALQRKDPRTHEK